MSARDTLSLDGATQRPIDVVAIPAAPFHDWVPVTVAMPTICSCVVVWDYARKLPHAAYYDPDENCWSSLHDGAPIEGVTEWADYLGPNRARDIEAHAAGAQA